MLYNSAYCVNKPFYFKSSPAHRPLQHLDLPDAGCPRAVERVLNHVRRPVGRAEQTLRLSHPGAEQILRLSHPAVLQAPLSGPKHWYIWGFSVRFKHPQRHNFTVLVSLLPLARSGAVG